MALYGFAYSLCTLRASQCGFHFRAPRTLRKHDSILVVVDRFSKMGRFILYSKTADASYMSYLFFRKIVCLHGLSKFIVFDRDVRFMSHFWHSLEENKGCTYILYDISSSN